MKRKVISIILIILLLTCGGLAIYGVTKRPVGSDAEYGECRSTDSSVRKSRGSNDTG